LDLDFALTPAAPVRDPTSQVRHELNFRHGEGGQATAGKGKGKGYAKVDRDDVPMAYKVEEVETPDSTPKNQKMNR